MAVRRICVNEVTSVPSTFSQLVVCSNPSHTPTGAGDENRVALFNVALNTGVTPPTIAFSYSTNMEYSWTQGGTTFMDYCDVLGQSGSLTLTSGVSTCCGFTPSVTYTAALTGITATSTMVEGMVNFAFTVSNLCSPTVICVDDTTCP